MSLGLVTAVHAEQVSKEQIKGLDEQVQEIKKDVLNISSELNLLEEKLLFPSNTQISFFVSMAGNEGFVPDAIQLKLDNKDVAHHIYSFKEVEALKSGGVQRVYTGNVRTGDHNLEINIIGDRSGNKIKNNSSHTVTKGVGPQFIEVQITNTGVNFRQW